MWSTSRLDELAALAASRQAACGTTRVVAIDGPSGSGKTSLADAWAERHGAAVFHLEDVYPGWEGLDATPPMVRSAVLEPLAVEEIGLIHRWDWEHGVRGSVLRVPPTRLLIVDGVGSGARLLRPFLSLLVWVDGPAEVRKQRALARDSGVYAPFWDLWAEQERRHFTAEGTRVAADVHLTTRTA